MKSYFYQVIVLFLFMSSLSFAKSKKVPYYKTTSVEQWQVVDLVFSAKSTIENPFIAEFSATFTGPNKEILIIPGFYNGEKEWIIRFSASAVGKWTFITSSEIKRLKGKKGAVLISKNINPNRHGGIVTKPENPQHFYYEDGTPYMQMAFECDWLFALDYHNKQAAPKTKHLLDLLRKNNLNQIVTTVFSFDPKWKKDSRLAKHPEHKYGGDLSIYPFLGTNKNPDFSRLNIEFFKQFDRTIQLMDERNIVNHLMIYVWNKQVSWPAAETEADNMYFDYIIKRYQAFSNIVWDVSKEALNNKRCSEEYGLERIDRIRNLDAYNRLASVHDYGFCERNSEAVDFISTQNWSATIYHDMLKNREDFPNKPIFNIEHGGYEDAPYVVFPGDYIDPEICLRRNYLINFAGVYSTYYWQGAAWDVIIHNPFKQPKGFIKPKFEYYKHMVDFFNKYNFSELVPDKESNNSGYCLTDNKGVFLLYVPKNNFQESIYHKSPFFAKTGTYQWFNTLTGEYGEEIQFKKGNFINPWYNKADAILIRKH